MSRLLDQLQTYKTDKQVHMPKPLKLVSGKFFKEDDYFGTFYSVRATLGAQVLVTPEMEELQGYLSQIIKQSVYRSLAEEVFGEFRRPLIDADFAIAQGEYREASQLIHGVLDSMFKV